MTKMTVIRYIWYKPFKIFFLRTSGPISTYLGMNHLGLWPILICSNFDPGLTLIYLMAMLSFAIILCFSKSENSGFSETIAACELNVRRCRSLIELIRICEYSRSKSNLDLGQTSFTYENSYLLFTETSWSFSIKFCMKPLKYKEMKTH